MRRWLIVGFLLICALALTASAATVQLEIRAVKGMGGMVYLLDNTTTVTGNRIQIVILGEATVDDLTIVVFGGGAVCGSRAWGRGETRFASFDVDIPPGATVQIAVCGEASVTRGWIYY